MRSNVDSCEVLQVIRTVSAKGDGVEGDPIRPVTEYWSLDGERLAYVDPIYCRLCGARNCTSSHK